MNSGKNNGFNKPDSYTVILHKRPFKLNRQSIENTLILS